jgi:hypothetical protein
MVRGGGRAAQHYHYYQNQEEKEVKGTVSKRLNCAGRARWAYVFDLGKDQNGKRRQMTKSGFLTQREAQDALSVAMAKARNAPPSETPESPAFEAFFTNWVDEHAARRCAPKTIERYRELGRYALKHIGAVPIKDLTTMQIQQTIHRLEDAGGAITKEHPQGKPLSAKTVRHIGTLLHTCLGDAVRLGHLAVNPMADHRVILPKLPKRKPPVLDTEKLGPPSEEHQIRRAARNRHSRSRARCPQETSGRAGSGPHPLRSGLQRG